MYADVTEGRVYLTAIVELKFGGNLGRIKRRSMIGAVEMNLEEVNRGTYWHMIYAGVCGRE